MKEPSLGLLLTLSEFCAKNGHSRLDSSERAGLLPGVAPVRRSLCVRRTFANWLAKSEATPLRPCASLYRLSAIHSSLRREWPIFAWRNTHFSPEDLREMARASVAYIEPDLDYALVCLSE